MKLTFVPLLALAVCMVIATPAMSQVETPTLSVSTNTPSGIESVDLSITPFSSTSGSLLQQSQWEVALDDAFTMIYAQNVYDFETDLDLSDAEFAQWSIENSLMPFGTPLYIRARWVDDLGNESDWSNTEMVTLSAPEGLSLIWSEDFDSTPQGSLPEGWVEFNSNPERPDPPAVNEGSSNFYNPELISWTVVDYDFLLPLPWYPTWADKVANPRGLVETELNIVSGGVIHSDSANFDSATTYYEAHVLTPEIDLTGVTDVFVTFNFNYVQNQDNIAVVEYTLDGGSVDMPAAPEHGSAPERTGSPVGSWYPVVYHLDTPDVILFDGAVDAEATLLNAADGTEFLWDDYVFARETTPYSELGAFIEPRVNDSATDGKRFMKFSLPELDNQASVKFRWAYMGTYSWYCGFDNFQIWGVSETSVNDWSLF